MALKRQGLFLAWAKRGLIIEFMVTLNIDLSHTFARPNIGYKIAHLCDATHLAPPRTGSALTYREGRAGEQISDVTCLMLHCYTIMSESAQHRSHFHMVLAWICFTASSHGRRG